MAVEFEEVPSTKIDRVGRSATLPIPGPVPSGDLPATREESQVYRRPAPAPTERIARAEAGLLGVARALFGGFFLYNGVNHFMQAGMLTEYARSKQVPLPQVAVAASGAMLIAGGLSLIAGARPKAGASLVAAFLLGVTPKMHNFWEIEDQQQRVQELTQFSKNLALLGGACFAAAMHEPWPLSLSLGSRPGRNAA